nr:MAG: putative RNA-dependent RNA polymerase [Barnaviridae sp.]
MFEGVGGLREKIERKIVKDSTPGYPYAVLGANNALVLERYGNTIWDIVCDRLNRMVEYTGNYHDLTPVELVKLGFCDPVKVFVKDEPHNKKKLVEGRVRLISSVSLVDQIIERMLHTTQNEWEIEHWPTCASKPGMGLHDDGMKVLSSNIQELLDLSGENMCTDISGWDWSVPEWLLHDDMECRIKLACADDKSLYAHLCRINAMVVSRSVYVDPDGFCWAQTAYGIQNSGRYCTSSSNSRMRVLLTVHCRLSAGKPALVKGRLGIISMGDDSDEVAFRDILDWFGRLGFTVKMVEYNTTVAGSEFCSQRFLGNGFAYPQAPAKTVFRFLSRPPTTEELPELWSQLSWYLRHLSGEEKEVIGKLAMARVERAINARYGNTSTTRGETPQASETATTSLVSVSA